MVGRVAKQAGWMLVVPSLVALVYSIVRANAGREAIGAVPWLDWQTYSNAAERFFSGGGIYDSIQLTGPYLLPHVVLTGYAYPPPSIFLVAPFAGSAPGLLGWLVLNAGILISGVAAIIRQSTRLSPPWSVSIAAISLSYYPPFAIGMAVGNLNVALAGLFAWSWVLVGQRRWLGGIAGAAALTKIFPGFLVAWSWRTHGWSQFRDAALAAAGLIVVTLPLVGLDSWIDFVRALTNAEPACTPRTISFACTLGPSLGTSAGTLLGIVTALAAIAGAMVVRSPFVAFALVALAMLAPISDIWLHYWLFPYVVIVAGVADMVGRRVPLRDQ